MEVNNHETFDRIIGIFNSNSDSFDLEFSCRHRNFKNSQNEQK